MELAKPTCLYLLGLVPLTALLLTWAAAQQRAALGKIGASPLIAALSDNASRRNRNWKTTLHILAITTLILALARPLWGTKVTVKAQRGVEIIVVLDVSASMMAEDIKPNRLTRAKLSIEELMDRLGGNDVGLVIFSGAAFVQFPLTADFNTARAFLDSAGPWSISRPGTALEQAIRTALDGFPEQRDTSRVILLLTDGEGHEGDPLAAATDAAAQDTVIHAIGFGSPGGEPIPIRDADGTVLGYKENAQGETVLSRLDEITLHQVVAETGGLYYRASAAGTEIAAIVEAIATLETGERDAQFETQGVERFEWFAGAALLTLAAETLIANRKKEAHD